MIQKMFRRNVPISFPRLWHLSGAAQVRGIVCKASNHGGAAAHWAMAIRWGSAT